MKRETIVDNWKAANRVGWINLPSAIAGALFIIAEALIEISAELKRRNDISDRPAPPQG